MFKLGYHTRGAILPGPHLLMTRLAAKQSHYCGLFLPQPTPRHRHRGRQPSRERWILEKCGGGESKKGKQETARQNPEKNKKREKLMGRTLFIDPFIYRSSVMHTNLHFISLSARHDVSRVSRVSFYTFPCLCCQHAVR